jgi:predicted dinucleotide-utilizing enzyme
MTPAPIAVNLIGAGRIGGPVADWLRTAAGLRLQAVIGRGDRDWPPAPLTIDTAGPEALRVFGAALLERGDLWTVGAAALLDPVLRARLEAVATRHGHVLRLFTGWISGPPLCPPAIPSRLHVIQIAPRLAPVPGLLFRGPLAEAAARFADHLNTATAAALAGPGIAGTSVELHSSAGGGPHRITARFTMPGQVVKTAVTFGDGPHPVAAALIAALARRGAWMRYG